MTAKTILVQMHHKVESLELLGKKLVLVIQDKFFEYMTSQFMAEDLREADNSQPAHFHSYRMRYEPDQTFSIELTSRYSTTALGIERLLGLRESANISEEDMAEKILAKISDETLLTI